MQKPFTLFLGLLAGSLLGSSTLQAQAVYTPLSLTGFSDDVVANGSGTAISSTTNDVDGGTVNNRFCFMAPDFVNPAGARPTVYLPASGLVTSVVTSTSGLTFQLAPYSANNSLRIQGVGTGTLTLATPHVAQEVFLLAVSGNQASTVTVTVNFTDQTSEVFASQTVSDWFGGSNFAIQGIGRVNRDNNAIQNNTTDPRLYQLRLAIPAASTSKLIQSIVFNKTSTTGTLNVMGVSVSEPPTPPQNDEPCGAVVLSGAAQAGTTLYATTSQQSGIVLPACTPAASPKDVWFSATPTGSTLGLTLTGTAAGMVRLYTSPDCAAGSFAPISCQAASASNVGFAAPVTFTGLTPGQLYYVAVSGYGSGDAGGAFSITAAGVLASRAATTVPELVYPNPSRDGQLTLRLPGTPLAGQATLLDALGRPVRQFALQASSTQPLSTRGLPAGVYVLRVVQGAQVLSSKVVVE